MKNYEINQKFTEYLTALNLTYDQSGKLSDGTYKLAAPNTVFLSTAPGLGRRSLYGIMRNVEGGTISPIFGPCSGDRIYGYMEGVIHCAEVDKLKKDIQVIENVPSPLPATKGYDWDAIGEVLRIEWGNFITFEQKEIDAFSASPYFSDSKDIDITAEEANNFLCDEPANSSFVHPELNSDFGFGMFAITGKYEYDINQTSVDPENYQLSIWEDGNGQRCVYNYDSQLDADQDLTLFRQNINKLGSEEAP
jgi:hypothetical protein